MIVSALILREFKMLTFQLKSLLVHSFFFIYIFVFIFFFYIACCFSCGHGCDGGFPRAAWEFYKYTGIVTGGNYNTSEGCLPYEIEACDHRYVSLMTFLFFLFIYIFPFLVLVELYHQ